MYPSSFGNYTNTPSADQSTSLSALTNNDLQIGVGTADNTGSNVNFAAANMKHVNGLAVVNLNAKTVPQTYYYDGNTGKASSVRAASTTTATVWPSVNFSSSTKPYSSSNTSSLKRYLAIVKPSTATTISTTATSGCEAWSLSYNVSQNTSSSQSVTSSRPGYYLGWVYSYKGAVETFTAPENANYKLEVWGAQGNSDGLERPGGLGGYSYGNYKSRANMNIYVCVGQEGQYGYPAYNNRRQDQPYFERGSSGGGATSITTNLDNRGTGELINYENYKDEILIVAGGGGGDDYGPLTDGYGGGLKGGDANGTGATTEKAGITTTGEGVIVTEATFGVGGYGYFKEGNDYGGQGGGGYYGGGGSPTAGSGGGGSGYVNTTLLTNNASTIAGNTSFTSPSGGTETGHSGNGCAIITQVSY